MSTFKPTPKENKVNALNPSIQLPKDRYVIRVKEQKFGPANSKPHNPMTTLICEILAPEIVTSPYTGEKIEVSGATLQPYYMVSGVKNEDGPGFDTEATQKVIDRLCEFRAKCQLPIPEDGIEPSNPPADYKGLVLDAILDSKEVRQTKPLTAEQKAQGKVVGEDILDANGKAIVSYFPEIKMILGKSSYDDSSNPMLS